jgi:hypothetical protein
VILKSILETKWELTVILWVHFLTTAQSKFPPKDESGNSPELKLFVSELKEIIANKDSRKLLEVVHPRIKFDFDDGIGIEKFKLQWKPEEKNSALWAIMTRVVELGGVFDKDGKNPFF